MRDLIRFVNCRGSLVERLQSGTKALEADGYGVDLDLSQTHTAVPTPVQHVVAAVDTESAGLGESENEKVSTTVAQMYAYLQY